MKKAILLLTMATVAAYGDAVRTPKQYTIEQLLDTVGMLGGAFSPDEKSIAVASDKSGVFNAYAVPTGGGEAKALTQSKESTFPDSYLPDGRLLIHRDRGGNENDHIYVLEKDGSEHDLTPGDKTKARFMGWNRQRSAFYLATNTRDPKAFDVFRVDVATLKPELLFQNDDAYEVAAVSDDGSHIGMMKFKSTSDSDIYLQDVKAKAAKLITPHTGAAQNAVEAFDPSGKYLYLTSNEGGEFAHLDRYELATGKRDVIDKEPWDVMYCVFSRNGKYRVVGINVDARTEVRIYDEATGKRVHVPDLPEGDITGVKVSDSESKIAFYLSSSRSPANLYIYDLKAGKATRLTDNRSKSVDEADLVDGHVVRYKSFDGMEIPGILYKPHQASASAKTPAIVEVHGGPGGQSRIGYSGIMQYLVNHGYTVLQVNNRGSSGYGKTFFKADDKKHGREPLWDCVEAKKYLNALGYVVPNKIAIVGGSYGGYMVLAALAFKPTEFMAGVDLFGISNWVRTLESIPPYWESEREALYQEIGDPKKDRDMLLTYSPLFHADKIVRPLMVLQGANDPRVIKPESDDIVNAVRKHGGVAEYVVFADEGHGFRKKANRIRGYGAMLAFLDKYVKNAPVPASTD